jgi:hypothetical protein
LNWGDGPLDESIQASSSLGSGYDCIETDCERGSCDYSADDDYRYPIESYADYSRDDYHIEEMLVDDASLKKSRSPRNGCCSDIDSLIGQQLTFLF